MAMYAHIVEDEVAQYPLYEGDIRLLFPNISWPVSGFNPPQNYVEVVSTDMPTIGHDKNISEGTPAFSGNAWNQVWVVTDASQSEIAARTAVQWASIRSNRNLLLQESDWTQLPDSPADKTAYEVYRQQLRDVTTQSDPFNIVWPVKP